MGEFVDQDLSGSRFERVVLNGSTFRRVRFFDVEMRAVHLNRFVMRGVELEDVDIEGELGRLIINGVDVASYVEDELNRRDPDRAKMRPADAAGFREAWAILERLWAGTIERARGLTDEQVHASVNDEWSFVQTLRHLVFAHDSWLRRSVLGESAPWHPLALPWDEAPADITRDFDRDRRVPLEEAVEMFRASQARVRAYLEALTDDVLAGDGPVPDGPGWPPQRSFPVRECLSIIVNETWEHRRYAERDLSILMPS